MKFTEGYRLNLNKTRWLSWLASFLIAAILLFDLSANLYEYFYLLPAELINPENRWIDTIVFFFHGLIVVFFVYRLIRLRIKSKSIFHFQIIWFIGWLLIFVYLSFMYLQCGKFPAVCGNYFSIPKSLLEVILGGYFVFSPILQIWKFLAALFPSKLRI
jgi:hypothetical protein